MYTGRPRATTPAEKKEVIKRLQALWLANPDLRLLQLIGNVYPCGSMPTIMDMKIAIAQDREVDAHKDPYHVEDYDFVATLENHYGSTNGKLTA